MIGTSPLNWSILGWRQQRPSCSFHLPVFYRPKAFFNKLLEKIKRWARELKAQLLTLWFCRFHPGTPLAAKLLAGFVVAYAFSPIDLIPDFIPVLGYLDDLIIVPAGIYLTLRLIPPHVLADARMRADEWIAAQKSRPRSNVAAAIIVALWIVILYWLWILVAEL